jgi:hypothetical protein
LYYYNGEGNIYLDDDDVSHNIDTWTQWVQA